MEKVKDVVKETEVVAENVSELVIPKKTLYDVKIKSVRVYNSMDAIRYRLQLGESILGIKKDISILEFIETKIDYIDFIPRVLIAQCLEHIPGLDLVYTKKKEESLHNGGACSFGAAELQAILRDASVKIERSKHLVGEEYFTTDGEIKFYEHDGYSTSIIEIIVSPKMQLMLDRSVESLFTF